ncbi:MAG: hypothetical protein PVH76_05585 [Myxococcales bacterium]
MPTSFEILRQLAQISDEQRPAAILWHGVLVALLVGLGLGFRPREHHARVALVAPIASASVFAWAYGNAFNGMVLGLGSAMLAMLGAYAPSPRRVQPAGFASTVAGVLILAVGWAYPDFEDSVWGWRAVIEAPVGVIPCPTLLVVTGLAVLGGGLGSAAWSAALCAIGLFYGTLGALHLGVTADWVLVVGAVLPVGVALRRR